MSGAVKITRALDPVRTGARWEQDILFTLADKTTPQAAWAGCMAEVVLSPKSAPIRAAHTFVIDEADVSVGATDARVCIRVPALTTADFRVADYVIEINRIDTDGERSPAAVGQIAVDQGLSEIAGGAALAGDLETPGALAGTIIVTATGSTIATGTGPKGETGPPGVTIGPTFTEDLEPAAQALWIKTGVGIGGAQIDLILVTGD